MNIKIDTYNSNQSIDKSTTSHSTAKAHGTGSVGGYALDISGIVTDNKAYGGHGKTAEDVMQEAGQLKDQLAVQKDYMAVMSNSVSEEDLARLQKEGFHPGSEDIETVVTIVDRIKASLAETGVNIVGFTDSLDVDTLSEAVGSEGLARTITKAFSEKDIPLTESNIADVMQACEKAEEIQPLSDGAVKYMVQNGLAPTFENVYKAQFSDTTSGDKQGRGYYEDSTKGYYARKADEYNWEQLQPQMEQVIKEAGCPVTADSLSNAKWLVEKGIPLTAQALTTLTDIKGMELPRNTEWLIQSAAAAIADGKSAKDALLTDNRSLQEQAVDIKSALDSISEEAADIVAAEGTKLNIRNLSAVSLRIELNVEIIEVSAQVNVHARRQLAEARLLMTIHANKQLLRSGLSLDTMELEQLIEALKDAEAERNMALTNASDAGTAKVRMESYQSTLQVLREIPSMPAAVLGRAAVSDSLRLTRSSFTLSYVHTEGAALKSAYESAGESYEALMTAPRSDLGDSIQKAFCNVDDILEDFQMELTAENRRAVRILGYNNMQITQEAVASIKATDKELTGVIKKLTPSAVLRLIRDGQNPLEMTVSELDDYLSQHENTPQQEAEDYRKFLTKLEKNADITEEEKESYIGIYRLIRQVEKTDGAVIGSLVNQGAELSFKNLLSAVRTHKNKGIHAVIDDKFGGLESLQTKGTSISEQIEAAYKVLEQLDSGQAQDALLKEELQDIQQVKEVGDDAVEQLLNSRQPVTIDNLLAADYLMHYRGKTFKKISEYAEKNSTRGQTKGNASNLTKAVEALQESFTDREGVTDAYGRLKETVTDVLETAAGNTASAVDMKSIVMLHKQISLASKFAAEENYEVPVNINGEVTSIHLKLVHGTGEQKVTASMQTEELGAVAAEFSVTKQHISLYIACSSRSGAALFDAQKQQIKAAFSKQAFTVTQLYVAESRELNMQTFERAEQGAEADTNTERTESANGLYRIAKTWIAFVQSIKS